MFMTAVKLFLSLEVTFDYYSLCYCVFLILIIHLICVALFKLDICSLH